MLGADDTVDIDTHTCFHPVKKRFGPNTKKYAE